MGSIDALALAIKEFEGGVVIVSHDFRAYLMVLLPAFRPCSCFHFMTRPHFASRRRSLGGQGQNYPQPHKGGYHHNRLQEESHPTEQVSPQLPYVHI